MTIKTLDVYGTPAPEEVAKLLSRVANCRDEDFAIVAKMLREDHRTLQQGVAGFAISLILAFAQNADDGRVDPRNEFSVGLCVKLREVLKAEGMVKPDGTAYRLPCV